MSPFKGFADSLSEGIVIPEKFFSEALPWIETLDELKGCLYFFRLIKSVMAADPFLTLDDLSSVEKTISRDQLLIALTQACSHGILLRVEYEGEGRYFLNTPRARAIQKAAAKGVWKPESNGAPVMRSQRPNLFTLYEQNIGPLTPIISQMLEEAEATYPVDWLEEAIKIAVKKNVRNWNYVEAILRSWKEKGRNEEDRRNNQKNPRSYIEGDLADYIKH